MSYFKDTTRISTNKGCNLFKLFEGFPQYNILTEELKYSNRSIVLYLDKDIIQYAIPLIHYLIKFQASMPASNNIKTESQEGNQDGIRGRDKPLERYREGVFFDDTDSATKEPIPTYKYFIEIFYISSRLNTTCLEIIHSLQQSLPRHNAVFVDLINIYGPQIENSYNVAILPSILILSSRFNSVLYLDSLLIPLFDPNVLFEKLNNEGFIFLQTKDFKDFDQGDVYQGFPRNPKTEPLQNDLFEYQNAQNWLSKHVVLSCPPKKFQNSNQIINLFLSGRRSFMFRHGIFLVNRSIWKKALLNVLKLGLCAIPLLQNNVLEREILWISVITAGMDRDIEFIDVSAATISVSHTQNHSRHIGTLGNGDSVAAFEFHLQPAILFTLGKGIGDFVYADSDIGCEGRQGTNFCARFGGLLNVYQTQGFVNPENIQQKTSVTRVSPWASPFRQCTSQTYDMQFFHWLQFKVPFWNTLIPRGPRSQLQQKTEVEFLNYFSALKKDAVIEGGYSGRGILFSSSPEIFSLTLISISIIRELGCNLPIEIWHDGELKKSQVRKFESFKGVTVHNLELIKPSCIDFTLFARDIDGKIFQMKTASILCSTLDEILFLDADNVPIRDPSFLFDMEGFRQTGAVFWPDFWKTRPDNPIWKITGLECFDEYEQESGQLLIAKNFPLVLQALRGAFYMQSRPQFYFNLLAGDKDTYRIAWRVLEIPYHMVDYHIAVLGAKIQRNNLFCGHSMVQFEPRDSLSDTRAKPLFIHSNQLKYQRALGRSPVFYIMRQFAESTSKIGRGRFGPGLCVDLVQDNEADILNISFTRISETFEPLYRHFWNLYR